MKNENRVLVPISEEEMDMAYCRCGTCASCKDVDMIGRGPLCCKKDCIGGLLGAFISNKK